MIIVDLKPLSCIDFRSEHSERIFADIADIVFSVRNPSVAMYRY